MSIRSAFRKKPEPKAPESVTISMEALEEGMVNLDNLMALLKDGEQLAALHVEALQLMAPTNPEETFIGALRNVLQAKMTALEVARQYGAILDEISAGVIAPGEWSREDLIVAFASRAEVYQIYGDTLSKLLLMLQVEFTAEDDMRVLMSKIIDAVANEQHVVQSTEVLVEIIESIAGYLGFPLDDNNQARSWTAAEVLRSLEGLVAHEKESLAFRRAVIETLELRPDVDILTQLKDLKRGTCPTNTP